MNAKEFLSRGINLQRHVETIREQIEHYKCLLNNCTATYSDMPKSTDLNYKLEECTQKIMDLQHELADALADLADVNCAIAKTIREIKNYDYQDLLVKRYVFGEPWEKIATDLEYDLRYVHKLHGRALHEIKIFS